MSRLIDRVAAHVEQERHAESIRPWIRHAVCKAMVHAGAGGDTDQVAQRFGWTGRAAVSPTTLSSDLAGEGVATFLRFLSPRSAAAQLFERAERLDMSGLATVTLPGWATDFPEPGFVAEGAPIPVFQGDMGAAELGPPKKLAAITALTGELAELSGEQAEAVIRTALLEAGARALDAALFSTAAASAIRPAGILNGISAITATTGGGINAVAGDLGNLANAIATAGGGASIVYFAAPAQAAALAAYAPGVAVIVGPSLDAGVVIAVEAAGFVSGFSAAPEIDVSKETVLHMEDTSPAQISEPGTPNVVAAPTRSAYQQDLIALRLILRTAWALRAPGLAAWIEGASW